MVCGEIMGLFYKDSEEMKIRTIKANDIYKGINCNISKGNYPFNQIKIYYIDDVSTGEDEVNINSNVINLRSRDFDTIFQVDEVGIIIKKATDDFNDFMIPFSNIIGAKAGKLPKEFVIECVGDQKINFFISSIKEDNLKGPKYLSDHIITVINNQASGKPLNEKLNFKNDNTTELFSHGKDSFKNNNIEFPNEWAKKEVAKIEDILYPMLGREGIVKLTATLEKIVQNEGYEEALNYLDYTQSRLKYYDDKKKDYFIESTLADKIYKSYVTAGISRLDKVNGRFLALQNMKLDIIIEQNTKIIELLEEIAKK